MFSSFQSPIWHPCSQMKDYETFPPISLQKAEGSYLYTKDGRKTIDAISSWWCKSLGHNHPLLKAALIKQLDQFEHVILANTSHDSIEELACLLCGLTQNLNKVFFAGDGSCAVEIALKMSLHAKKNAGEIQRTKFIALKNSYHGETTGALSVSDLGVYRDAYRDILFPVDFIENIPYVHSQEDLLWGDCSAEWEKIEAQLEKFADQTVAVIVEPIVQAAGQMRMYSQDFLRRLRAWTQKNNIYLIADEIMTGFYRAGKMFGFQHADIEPDILCVGKALTGGWLPMSAVLTTEKIYQLFYGDYELNKAFLHSHTFSGNALASSVALAALQIYNQPAFQQRCISLEKKLGEAMHEVAERTTKLKNVRHIGGVAAADLVLADNRRRAGYEVFQKAIELGALLRPLGNTIYWVPPLNIHEDTLNDLKEITIRAIGEVV